MKIASSYFAHRTTGDAVHSYAPESPADALARKACAKVAHAHAGTFSMKQDDVVITAVSAALTRALMDPNFSALPEKQKAEAASLLAEQFMQGQRLVQALTSAMNNPSTLATQLKYNSQTNAEVNVFESIIDASRPRVTPESSHMAFIGTLQ